MLSFAVTPEQFQHDVCRCYVIMIMRVNTPLVGLFESAVWALLPVDQTHMVELEEWVYTLAMVWHCSL